MRAIRSQGTIPEKLLGTAMFRAGLRYRKCVKDVPGRPDFAFHSARVAVFVDGSFWHGYRWDEKKSRLSSNKDYWVPKIERNIARDAEINTSLQALGWTVIRFWDFEVLKGADGCAQVVEAKVREMSSDGKQ